MDGVLGGALDDAEFPTTPIGYAAASVSLHACGPVTVVGVEGTSSYGAGLTRAAGAAGIEVRRGDVLTAPSGAGSKSASWAGAGTGCPTSLGAPLSRRADSPVLDDARARNRFLL